MWQEPVPDAGQGIYPKFHTAGLMSNVARDEQVSGRTRYAFSDAGPQGKDATGEVCRSQVRRVLCGFGGELAEAHNATGWECGGTGLWRYGGGGEGEIEYFCG